MSETPKKVSESLKNKQENNPGPAAPPGGISFGIRPEFPPGGISFGTNDSSTISEKNKPVSRPQTSSVAEYESVSAQLKDECGMIEEDECCIVYVTRCMMSDPVNSRVMGPLTPPDPDEVVGVTPLWGSDEDSDSIPTVSECAVPKPDKDPQTMARRQVPDTVMFSDAGSKTSQSSKTSSGSTRTSATTASTSALTYDKKTNKNTQWLYQSKGSTLVVTKARAHQKRYPLNSFADSGKTTFPNGFRQDFWHQLAYLKDHSFETAPQYLIEQLEKQRVSTSIFMFRPSMLSPEQSADSKGLDALKDIEYLEALAEYEVSDLSPGKPGYHIASIALITEVRSMRTATQKVPFIKVLQFRLAYDRNTLKILSSSSEHAIDNARNAPKLSGLFEIGKTWQATKTQNALEVLIEALFKRDFVAAVSSAQLKQVQRSDPKLQLEKEGVSEFATAGISFLSPQNYGNVMSSALMTSKPKPS